MNQVMAYTCLNLDTPCAVIGKSGMPFFNPAMQALLDSPLALELFRAQEQKARESGQFFSVQNVQPYGPKQTLQPYLFDFYPQFDCVDDPSEDVEFECIGTVCHARPFAFGSTRECVDGEAPRPAMFEPDRRFTEKQQKIIFFALHGLTSKDIGQRMGISHRTVENRMQVIFDKIGANSTRELVMYCRENGTDRYIPPSLLSLSSHVLSQGGVA